MSGARGCDVAVVGAGIVGLAAADALSRRGASVLVVEAEREVAAHQSGHNSGVIHAGLYYRPGTDKARLCRAGRELLLDLCRERGVPHEVCGKLVLATRDEELPRLDELEARGRANGLVGLRRLDGREVREREPHARGVAGLLVPETGVVDFRRVAAALADRAREHGATLRLDARVTAVEGVARDGGSRRLDRRPRGVADRSVGGSSGSTHAHPLDADLAGVALRTTAGPFHAGRLLNCAGLQADRVARLCGVDPGVTLVPFRGEYRRLVPARRDLVRHIVYPVPDPALPFLGVHFTRTIDGEVEVGPDAVLTWSREGYARGAVRLRDVGDMLSSEGFRRMARRWWRTGLAELLRSRSERASVRAMRRLVPAVRRRDVVPAGVGVRAQAVAPDGALVDDFVIERGPRSVHVVNAPSPAATAALAIGEEVAGLVAG